GETLEQRETNITNQVLTEQVTGVLGGIPAADVERSIVAYEPVWAIGTGKTASKEQAEDAHRLIRSVIAQLYSAAVADNVVIQYGGSVKADNAIELLSQPNIDGALVGGASLDANQFTELIKNAALVASKH
ncbi:MAG: triose-phosphate isomerase, partial [Gammaproteobacteria bacterium]|nr:triose-phosphate isomerase [Gammaproteobacteria bacterium]